MLCFFMYYYSARCVAMTLAFFSILAALCSGATIYLAVRLYKSDIWAAQSEPENSESQVDIDKAKRVIMYLIFAMASFSVLVGLFGAITAKARSCCTIGFYSFISMLSFIGLLGLGGLLISLDISARSHVDDYCDNLQSNSFTNNVGRSYLNLAGEIDHASNTWVDQYMCSYQCPCVSVDKSKWGDRQQILQNSTQYNFNGTYTNFYSCYLDLVKDGTLKPASDTILNIIRSMEEKSQCATVCQSKLFWFFKDVRTGPPQNSCRQGLKRVFDEYIGATALALLISGFIMFLAFNAQYGLWRKRFTSRESYYKAESEI